ncbi:MAG: sugar-binding protein [Selenomonadaceae bacterium]|nr:sugar-binding protein [Selenomonadaceae bacterium]
MKKFFLIILSSFIFLALTGCGVYEEVNHNANDVREKTKQRIIGILMPKRDSLRWTKDGDNLRYEFEKRGYKVDMQNSENDTQRQQDQLKYMIENGADIIIVAAVDSEALAEVLAEAKTKNIPVIAYDRLIMNTDAVSYYVSFDNKAVGRLLGEYIENTFGLNNGAGNFNVEFFAGSVDDNNARIVNDSLLEVLQPYIDNGQLNIPSGQIDFDQTTIYRWRNEESNKRMGNILENVYGGQTPPDAVICASDSISSGVISALEAYGFRAPDYWPIVTGQDGDVVAARNIITGKQSMTIFKDTRVLSAKCAEMVDDLFNGNIPDINDNMTYDNGEIIVPSYLCQPVVVTKDNFKEVFLDTGYYAPEDVGL